MEFHGIKGTLSSLRQFLETESPLKMMKNVFYFTLKALLVLMIFKFWLEFSVMSKNGFIRKRRLISKFMTSQLGQQTISKHILTNISRSKSNQAIFGQVTLIWVGFLGIRFEVGGGGEITTCLKLVRIMLET